MMQDSSLMIDVFTESEYKVFNQIIDNHLSVERMQKNYEDAQTLLIKNSLKVEQLTIECESAQASVKNANLNAKTEDSRSKLLNSLSESKKHQESLETLCLLYFEQKSLTNELILKGIAFLIESFFNEMADFQGENKFEYALKKCEAIQILCSYADKLGQNSQENLKEIEKIKLKLTLEKQMERVFKVLNLDVNYLHENSLLSYGERVLSDIKYLSKVFFDERAAFQSTKLLDNRIKECDALKALYISAINWVQNSSDEIIALQKLIVQIEEMKQGLILKKRMEMAFESFKCSSVEENTFLALTGWEQTIGLFSTANEIARKTNSASKGVAFFDLPEKNRIAITQIVEYLIIAKLKRVGLFLKIRKMLLEAKDFSSEEFQKDRGDFLAKLDEPNMDTKEKKSHFLLNQAENEFSQAALMLSRHYEEMLTFNKDQLGLLLNVNEFLELHENKAYKQLTKTCDILKIKLEEAKVTASDPMIFNSPTLVRQKIDKIINKHLYLKEKRLEDFRASFLNDLAKSGLLHQCHTAGEAQELLKGKDSGTFLLRPGSKRHISQSSPNDEVEMYFSIVRSMVVNDSKIQEHIFHIKEKKEQSGNNIVTCRLLRGSAPEQSFTSQDELLKYFAAEGRTPLKNILAGSSNGQKTATVFSNTSGLSKATLAHEI